MTPTYPLVSVIIPAYNHAPYIRQCVDSALAQTYPAVEVVVVDDGSTDGTYELLQTYGERITLIRQANRGTQAARNTAIAASTGEYLALLDSDDAWLPHKLAQQMQLFAEHPDTALVYSLANAIDQAGLPAWGGASFGKTSPDPDRVYETLLWAVISRPSRRSSDGNALRPWAGSTRVSWGQVTGTCGSSWPSVGRCGACRNRWRCIACIPPTPPRCSLRPDACWTSTGSCSLATWTSQVDARCRSRLRIARVLDWS